MLVCHKASDTVLACSIWRSTWVKNNSPLGVERTVFEVTVFSCINCFLMFLYDVSEQADGMPDGSLPVLVNKLCLFGLLLYTVKHSTANAAQSVPRNNAFN